MFDHFLDSGKRLLERFLLLWLVLLSAVAFYWTTWFPAPEHLDPFVGARPAINYLIALTMLAIGSLLPRDEIHQVLKRWPTVLGGTAVQYTAMPLLAYGAGRLFGFEGGTLYGIVLVGCVPGAMASNVLTLAARGNVSYSVSLTTSATLLSPLVVPLALRLTLGEDVQRDKLVDISVNLLWTVVAPVVLGYLLSRFSAVWRGLARRLASMVANLTILWIIAIVVGLSREKLSQPNATLVLALLAVNVGGYLAGFGGGHLLRLPGAMRRALTLEVGMQNAGVGTMLAVSFFLGDETIAHREMTVIPPALYTFGCMLTGTILARLWAEFGPAPSSEAAE